VDVAEWRPRLAPPILLLLLLLLITDGIKALDSNGKALKKKKCLSWVVSVSRDSMAQCRNEFRTDLVNWINWTERLKGDGKEMMIACNLNIFLFFAFGRRFSCWGCTSGWHTQVRGGKPAFDNARHIKSFINEGAGSAQNYACKIVQTILLLFLLL